MVDDRDAVGELVGLVEVLRGQQDRAAVADEVPDGVPHLAAGARVQAGRGLVQEDQGRPGDQARGQVEAPAHAAGELLDRLGRRLLQVELLEQPGGRRARLGPAEALEPAEEVEVLGGGQQLVDRGVLAGDPQELADDVRVAAYVDPEDLRVARLHREQRGQHLHQGRLAGAVGAEHAEDLTAADLEVDAVDGAVVAEGLDQPVRGDRRQLVVERGMKCSCGHRAGHRFHRGFMAVSSPRRARVAHYARRVTGLDDLEARLVDALDEQALVDHLTALVRLPSITGTAEESELQQRSARGVRRLGARRRHLGAGPRRAARRPALPRHRGGAGRGLRDGRRHRPRHARRWCCRATWTSSRPATWPSGPARTRSPPTSAGPGRGYLHGRGACDMKAGVAANAAVVRTLAAQGVTLSGRWPCTRWSARRTGVWARSPRWSAATPATPA